LKPFFFYFKLQKSVASIFKFKFQISNMTLVKKTVRFATPLFTTRKYRVDRPVVIEKLILDKEEEKKAEEKKPSGPLYDKFVGFLDRSKIDYKKHQYEGVDWCVKNETDGALDLKARGGFIADEMGLGKTIMMIAVMAINFQPKTLIVVPPVLLRQWAGEIFRTTGHQPLIYHGKSKKECKDEDLLKAPIVLVTYHSVALSKKAPKCSPLHLISWSRVIFDEAHHLRNRNTTRFIGCKAIKAPIRWLVSGTPVQNRKQDFYSLCNAAGLPPSFYTEDENLQLIVKHFVLKRTKKQAGIGLPEPIVDGVCVKWQTGNECKLSQEIHSALKFSGVVPLKEEDSALAVELKKIGVLQLILRARQSCILPRLMKGPIDTLINQGYIEALDHYANASDYSSKLDEVTRVLLERRDNGNGKLVFCHFREEIDEIATRLRAGGVKKVVTFDGRNTGVSRVKALEEPCDALIMQIQTGCEGLNLQANYSEIYFVSPHWNPAIEDQAIARCYRIGQKKQVYVFRFIMDGFGSMKVPPGKEEEEGLVKKDVWRETIALDGYVSLVQDLKRELQEEVMGKLPVAKAVLVPMAVAIPVQ